MCSHKNLPKLIPLILLFSKTKSSVEGGRHCKSIVGPHNIEHTNQAQNITRPRTHMCVKVALPVSCMSVKLRAMNSGDKKISIRESDVEIKMEPKVLFENYSFIHTCKCRNKSTRYASIRQNDQNLKWKMYRLYRHSAT